jgi:hypothetical protein
VQVVLSVHDVAELAVALEVRTWNSSLLSSGR